LSSNYFKSFNEIHVHSADLVRHLPEAERYWAHLHRKKPPEKLEAHTERVAHYALKLIQIHHLETVVNRLVYALTRHQSVRNQYESGNFVKELFWNTILFHDYGKINENFQVERMENPWFKKNPGNKIGSRHSVLSAFLFIAFHLSFISEKIRASEEEKNFLSIFIFPFASVILKHHASYFDHELNIPTDWTDTLYSYLEKLNIRINSQVIKAGMESFQDEQTFYRITDFLFSGISPFPLFGLLRLCFSLLTAADYYATNDYTMDIKIDDFGILKDQDVKRLYDTFKRSKRYNKDFFENRAFYRSIPFDTLKDRNPKNLNRLRQKLLAEVLDAVETHKDEHVFYLEAPTGAGKTNVSLAIALHLLNSHSEINKIFYVFPFTTLITQTAKSIKETLNLDHSQIVQLHSRSGFHAKREEAEDGQYGKDHLNYIDNLFVNFPIALMTHIKFFDILKSTRKENIYLLHRLANSIVIVDELQSYPPEEWDKIKFFISNYAHYFNIRFILMSATLPKLDALRIPGERDIPIPREFIPLLSHPEGYFQNPNFKGRVEFDFSIFEQAITIEELADFVYEKCEEYACSNNGSVKGIIEFIFKKRASEFYNHISERLIASGYQLFLLSGTILEPRRKEIIDYIKQISQKRLPKKLLLITTQVVEAGVDIDMDIGFKNRSLIDSDEQLAGRVNRNARPIPARVYLFNLDRAYSIYGKDLRYQITRDKFSTQEYQRILQNKQFNMLYQQVCDSINRNNSDEFIQGIRAFREYFVKLRYSKVDRMFQLIRDNTVTVYVPLNIPIQHFSENDITFLRDISDFDWSDLVNGANVWEVYENIIRNETSDFVKKRIDLKKIYGIMSQFMFSIHANSRLLSELKPYADLEIFQKFNILYLLHWEKIYSYEVGINENQFSEAMFF